MNYYYYGMGFRKIEAEKKAKVMADRNGCKYKISKSKDPIGGFIYKVYFSKRNVK